LASVGTIDDRYDNAIDKNRFWSGTLLELLDM
jgi:hypothetical protein